MANPYKHQSIAGSQLACKMFRIIFGVQVIMVNGTEVYTEDISCSLMATYAWMGSLAGLILLASFWLKKNTVFYDKAEYLIMKFIPCLHRQTVNGMIMNRRCLTNMKEALTEIDIVVEKLIVKNIDIQSTLMI